MLKIGLHVDAVAHRLPGGIPTYVRRLVDELLLQGEDELRLLVCGSAARLPDHWPPSAIERARLGLRSLYVAWNYLRLPRISGVDVVHATNLVIPPSTAPLVATIHDDNVDRFPELVPRPWRDLYRRGTRIALAEAAVLCANSEATRVRTMERYDVDPDRIVVTPLAPGVRPGDPEEPGTLERLGIRRPYVLHVSTLEPRKNQDGLVRAFGLAAGQLGDHQLVLTGARGWANEETLGEIERSGLTDRIVLTGQVGAGELAALYRQAGAFALPSHYEGFGIPLTEALAYGIPSVASTDAALCEVSGGAALHVAAGDDEGLAGALVRLCGDGELRSRLQQEGPAAASRFSWSRTAEVTREAYVRAAEVTGKARRG